MTLPLLSIGKLIREHDAFKENRAFLYRQMYQKAAEKWVEHKIVSHAVSLYAHDRDGIETLEAEGWTHLGVDYESINSTAAHFWPKYFEPYTSGVVRRIDECALGAIS